MKFTICSAATLCALALAPAATALAPRSIQSELPLPACVSTCINNSLTDGSCTTPGPKCVCADPKFQPCVQQGCPPSLVNPAGQYCGTISTGVATPTATGTLATSGSVHPTTRAATTTASGIFLTSVAGSVPIVTASAAATTTARSSGFATAPVNVAFALGAAGVAAVLAL